MATPGPDGSMPRTIVRQPVSLGEELSGPLRVVVKSDQGQTIGDAALLPGWISTRHSDVAQRLARVEGHDQWVLVRIGGKTYDYRVIVMAVRDGAPVGPPVESFRCTCNDETLLERLDGPIAAAVEVLETGGPRTEAVAAPEPAPDVADPLDAATPQLSMGADRRRLSGLGVAGIVAMVFGAGSLGGGVAMLRAEAPVVADRTGLSRNLRAPGFAALAVGGSVLAAGVSMLVVDVVQCRQADGPRRCEQRDHVARTSRLEVGPSLGASGGGITVSGRF